MKNFFTSMLGALAAMVVFSLGLFVVFFGILGIIAALGNSEKTPSLERGSYVVVDLSSNLTDAPAPIDFGDLMGSAAEHTRTLQLRTVTQALRAAAKDNRVAGIFLKGSVLPVDYGSGFAALKEVRAALEAVRAAGKPVKAYLTYATTKDLYLASTASELTIDPYGMIVMPGLASEPMFYTGAFEKYGVNIQVTRVGKYKSFVEPFTRKDMSPENREQIQKLLNDIWGDLIADVAKSRKLTPADVQKVVDAEGIIRPEAALAGKLVDRIAYRDEVIDELKQQTRVTETKESFKQVSLASYIKTVNDPVGMMGSKNSDTFGGKGRIAVVYAEGDIVDGEGESTSVGGTKYATELRRLRLDDNVKAIVLRVNSPGGSASASEAIQREIRLAKKVKPVVVSMGTYAASGGYWISTYGDRIYAEPTTITGSIGVFGIQFDVKRLANEHGITFDSVKTGRYADMLTISRPKTPDEMAVFQRMVDWSYGEFIKKVSESRGLPKEKVEEIAQGRVWSGLEAKNLGLVDEIGGLDAALKYAAEKAGLGTNFRISEYPRKKELFEAISEWFDNVNPMATRARAGLVAQVLERVKTDLKAIQSFNDPAGLYARLPLELTIR